MKKYFPYNYVKNPLIFEIGAKPRTWAESFDK